MIVIFVFFLHLFGVVEVVLWGLAVELPLLAAIFMRLSQLKA